MGQKTFLITSLISATLMNFAHTARAYDAHESTAREYPRKDSALFITAEANPGDDPLYALCARKNAAAIALELTNVYPELKPQMSFIQPENVTLAQLLDVTGTMTALAMISTPGDISVAASAGTLSAIELNLDFSATFGNVSIVGAALKQELAGIQDYRNMACRTFSSTPRDSSKSLVEVLKYEGGVERIEETVPPLR